MRWPEVGDFDRPTGFRGRQISSELCITIWVKADVLNGLLVMPGHELHQEVTMEIQRLKSLSSVPCIRSVLEGGFDFLAYTSSGDEVIAKWFSHALAKIGTREAIEVIKEFSVADNVGIAEEMSYRLGKLAI